MRGIVHTHTHPHTHTHAHTYTHTHTHIYIYIYIYIYIFHMDFDCEGYVTGSVNPLTSELNPICHFLTLLGAHHILHVSRIRIKCNKPGNVHTYNEIWRRICATILQWKITYVLHILSVYLWASVSSMQCASTMLSSVVCPAVHISPHYLIKGTSFRKKKNIEHKFCVLLFSTTFVWIISHSKKNWAKCYQNVHRVFM